MSPCPSDSRLSSIQSDVQESTHDADHHLIMMPIDHSSNFDNGKPQVNDIRRENTTKEKIEGPENDKKVKDNDIEAKEISIKDFSLSDSMQIDTNITAHDNLEMKETISHGISAESDGITLTETDGSVSKESEMYSQPNGTITKSSIRIDTDETFGTPPEFVLNNSDNTTDDFKDCSLSISEEIVVVKTHTEKSVETSVNEILKSNLTNVSDPSISEDEQYVLPKPNDSSLTAATTESSKVGADVEIDNHENRGSPLSFNSSVNATVDSMEPYSDTTIFSQEKLFITQDENSSSVFTKNLSHADLTTHILLPFAEPSFSDDDMDETCAPMQKEFQENSTRTDLSGPLTLSYTSPNDKKEIVEDLANPIVNSSVPDIENSEELKQTHIDMVEKIDDKQLAGSVETAPIPDDDVIKNCAVEGKPSQEKSDDVNMNGDVAIDENNDIHLSKESEKSYGDDDVIHIRDEEIGLSGNTDIKSSSSKAYQEIIIIDDDAEMVSVSERKLDESNSKPEQALKEGLNLDNTVKVNSSAINPSRIDDDDDFLESIEGSYSLIRKKLMVKENSLIINSKVSTLISTVVEKTIDSPLIPEGQSSDANSAGRIGLDKEVTNGPPFSHPIENTNVTAAMETDKTTQSNDIVMGDNESITIEDAAVEPIRDLANKAHLIEKNDATTDNTLQLIIVSSEDPSSNDAKNDHIEPTMQTIPSSSSSSSFVKAVSVDKNNAGIIESDIQRTPNGPVSVEKDTLFNNSNMNPILGSIEDSNSINPTEEANQNEKDETEKNEKESEKDVEKESEKGNDMENEKENEMENNKENEMENDKENEKVKTAYETQKDNTSASVMELVSVNIIEQPNEISNSTEENNKDSTPDHIAQNIVTDTDENNYKEKDENISEMHLDPVPSHELSTPANSDSHQNTSNVAENHDNDESASATQIPEFNDTTTSTEETVKESHVNSAHNDHPSTLEEPQLQPISSASPVTSIPITDKMPPSKLKSKSRPKSKARKSFPNLENNGFTGSNSNASKIDINRRKSAPNRPTKLTQKSGYIPIDVIEISGSDSELQLSGKVVPVPEKDNSDTILKDSQLQNFNTLDDFLSLTPLSSQPDHSQTDSSISKLPLPANMGLPKESSNPTEVKNDSNKSVKESVKATSIISDDFFNWEKSNTSNSRKSTKPLEGMVDRNKHSKTKKFQTKDSKKSKTTSKDKPKTTAEIHDKSDISQSLTKNPNSKSNIETPIEGSLTPKNKGSSQEQVPIIPSTSSPLTSNSSSSLTPNTSVSKSTDLASIKETVISPAKNAPSTTESDGSASKYVSNMAPEKVKTPQATLAEILIKSNVNSSTPSKKRKMMNTDENNKERNESSKGLINGDSSIPKSIDSSLDVVKENPVEKPKYSGLIVPEKLPSFNDVILKRMRCWLNN